MEAEDIKLDLKKELSEFRYKHTLGCANTCRDLAEKLGCNEEKAYLAGLLHDCAKEMDFAKQLDFARKHGYAPDDITLNSLHILHAPVSAMLAKEKYGIDDEEILDAIACHTTGKENMTLLDRILFVADLIEPNRAFDGVDELRNKVNENFALGSIAVFDQAITIVLFKGGFLHPNTVYARNKLLKEIM